jgi:hypothetical protein
MTRIVHIQGEPTGAALALKMRPTTSPFASTPKSLSFSPDGREAEARLVRRAARPDHLDLVPPRRPTSLVRLFRLVWWTVL